jgi:hypothetical protein
MCLTKRIKQAQQGNVAGGQLMLLLAVALQHSVLLHLLQVVTHISCCRPHGASKV